MPTLRGITADIALSNAMLPAYPDPDLDQEPNTTSSYIEAISNRWFHALLRIPRDYEPQGDVFVIKVYLDGRRIAEIRPHPGDQLPTTPHPEGEAGFAGDIAPQYDPGSAIGLRDLEAEQRAHDEAEQWLMAGYISGLRLRFPYLVTDNNKHEAGDAAEWEGKEIVVQFSEGVVHEEPSENAFGNYIPAKVQTVGDVLAFTFKHRPRRILKFIFAHKEEAKLARERHARDADSPDSDKTIRPPKGKGRAELLDSNATVRPNMPPSKTDTRRPVWNPDMLCIDWLTETDFAQRMQDIKGGHPADEQWRDNIQYFNSPGVYCCKRLRPTSQFVWCDNADCEIQVFHWVCVGLTKEPHWGLNRWFCPICRDLPEEELRLRTEDEGAKMSHQMG